MNISMARLIYSIAALTILTVGVMSELWENMLNIPEDDLKAILQTSLFPARQLRNRPCNCTSKKVSLDLGRHHHPRYLVTNQCEYETCAHSLNECQNIEYTVNVSVFRDTDRCVDENLFGQQETCYHLIRTTPKTITVACMPVLSKRIMQSNRIRP